ncbi:Protein MEI2-like 5 [Durusdinium trenchii]|uniref:Protein MEI2-like 5 n=1 Tax=Durusdinium trenchii TaxID=1381693 RepID=A0ABP0PXP6_9DINO
MAVAGPLFFRGRLRPALGGDRRAEPGGTARGTLADQLRVRADADRGAGGLGRGGLLFHQGLWHGDGREGHLQQQSREVPLPPGRPDYGRQLAKVELPPDNVWGWQAQMQAKRRLDAGHTFDTFVLATQPTASPTAMVCKEDDQPQGIPTPPGCPRDQPEDTRGDDPNAVPDDWDVVMSILKPSLGSMLAGATQELLTACAVAETPSDEGWDILPAKSLAPHVYRSRQKRPPSQQRSSWFKNMKAAKEEKKRKRQSADKWSSEQSDAGWQSSNSWGNRMGWKQKSWWSDDEEQQDDEEDDAEWWMTRWGRGAKIHDLGVMISAMTIMIGVKGLALSAGLSGL